MFDLFDDGSRRSLSVARTAAQRLGHDFIGTEHVLLGLVESDGLQRTILERYRIGAEAVRSEVEKRCPRGASAGAGPQLPFTPYAKRILELAVEEVARLEHREIRPEHLLIGLLAEPDGIGGKVLRDQGLDLEKVRKDIAMLGGQEKAIARASAEHPCGGAGPSACPAVKSAGAGACPDDQLVSRVFDLELVSKDILRAQREQEARLAEIVSVLRKLWILAWVTAAAATGLAIAALAR